MALSWLVPATLDRRRLLYFAVATFVAHVLSLLFIRFGGPLAPLWPPVGIAFAALLTLPRDHRSLVLLGYVAIDTASNLINGFFTPPALAYTLITVSEVMLAEALMRRMASFPVRLAKTNEVFVLLASAAIASAAVSMPAAFVAHYFNGQALSSSALVWWLGDVIAYMTVTPLALLLVQPLPAMIAGRRAMERLTEALLLAIMVLFVAIVGFVQDGAVGTVATRPYMLMVPMLWATLRFGQLGALFVIVEATVVGVTILTLNRTTMLGGATAEESLIGLQVFLIVMALTSLVLATAFREQRDTAERNAEIAEVLQASEQRLRQSQKMEAIGQLAGGVAHDFNNALAAIMLQLEELRLVRAMPTVARTLIVDVETSVQRAARLTRQLLVFSRQQAMQVQLLDLNTLVRTHVRLLRRVLPSTHALATSLHPGALVVAADGGMIEQVLLNLVLNARDAQPAGGSITIATAWRVLAHPDGDLVAGDYAVLSVSDTGEGIAPEHLSRVFEPFFTTKPPGQGTGLGLATTYGIVQQHRGGVRVATQVGRGTTMDVWLPLSRDPLPAEAAVEGDSTTDEAWPAGTGPTILVVEDEDTVRRLMRRVLEREGYVVRTAGSGREALDWWVTGGTEVDLVITDLVMPGDVSGTALARELRRQRPDLPVVFTSGYDPDFDPDDLTMVPGENFIPKPSPSAQILSVVRRQLVARVR